MLKPTSPLRWGLMLSLLSFLTTSEALTDDHILREGQTAETGVRLTQIGQSTPNAAHVLHLKSDLDLIRIPGGGRVNGTRLQLTLSDQFAGPNQNIDSVGIQLLNWANLRALGIHIDRATDPDPRIHLLGTGVPIVLWGQHEALGYGVLLIQGDYSLQLKETAQHLIQAGCRLEAAHPLSDRMMLEFFVDLKASLSGTISDGTHDVWAEIKAGGALILDLSGKPRFRVVNKTDWETGEIVEQKVPEKSVRAKLKIIGLDTQLQLDNQNHARSSSRIDQVISTGLRYEF